MKLKFKNTSKLPVEFTEYKGSKKHVIPAEGELILENVGITLFTEQEAVEYYTKMQAALSKFYGDTLTMEAQWGIGMKKVKFTNTSTTPKKFSSYNSLTNILVPGATVEVVDKEQIVTPGSVEIEVDNMVAVTSEESMAYYQKLFKDSDIQVEVVDNTSESQPEEDKEQEQPPAPPKPPESETGTENEPTDPQSGTETDPDSGNTENEGNEGQK